MSNAPWTAAEDDLLRRVYARSSTRKGRALARCCAALPHRTRSAVSSRASLLRVTVHSRAWTQEEVLTLRREWGELTERVLRQKLPGRTISAIYGKAKELGLPAQSDGRTGYRHASTRLGVDLLAIRKLITEVGMTLGHVAPINPRGRRFARREVDVDALEVILRHRDLRCTTSSSWDTAHGLSRSVTSARARRAGVFLRGTSGGRVYVPREVFAEVSAGGPGAACALWQRAVAEARTEHCAPWVLHLAAIDLQAGGEAAAWVGEALPQRVARAARALAGLRHEPQDEERAA